VCAYYVEAMEKKRATERKSLSLVSFKTVFRLKIY
jgi:hypothetical protein